MRILIIAGLLLNSALASAEIYQWVDAEGRRHFSDRQIDNAEALEFFDSRHEPIKSGETERAPATPKKKSVRQPEKKAITADDYNISVRAAQVKDRVILSGRISEGPPCKQLKLDFTLQDEDGHLIHLITVVRDIGGFLSELLEASKKVKYGDTGHAWEIIATSGVCQK